MKYTAVMFETTNKKRDIQNFYTCSPSNIQTFQCFDFDANNHKKAIDKASNIISSHFAAYGLMAVYRKEDTKHFTIKL